MAIPLELRAFKSEEAFREEFVIPFLRRLGFSLVINYHGQREFGRDIVFGEHDRFGHPVYHAVQVKHASSISQKASHGLVDDCKECFRMPFIHPQTGAEHRIARFYVVNSGSIADNARALFFAGTEPHSANAVLLTGIDILSLNRWVVTQRDDSIREQLAGILWEVVLNRDTSGFLLQALESYGNGGPYPLRRCRTDCCAAFLARPPIAVAELADNMNFYTEAVRCLNRIVDIAGLAAFQVDEAELAVAKESHDWMAMYSARIEQQATKILDEMAAI